MFTLKCPTSLKKKLVKIAFYISSSFEFSRQNFKVVTINMFTELKEIIVKQLKESTMTTMC